MERFLEKQDKANTDITQKIETLANCNKDLEDHISKMARKLLSITRGKGKFSGQPEENPRETCKCITHTLRRGTAYEGARMPNFTPDKTHVQPPHSNKYEQHQSDTPIIKALTDPMEKQNDTTGGDRQPTEPEYIAPPTYKPPLPFPHRQVKHKMEKQFARFLKTLKQMQITILFT